MAKVRLVFADGDESTFEAASEETILAGARRHGIALASDCEVGDCQTCRAQLADGTVVYDETTFISLDENEVSSGAVLPCVAVPSADVTVQLPYARASLLPERRCRMTITAINRLCEGTIELRGRILRGKPLLFHPGQYINLTVPGRGVQRSYSMANAPEEAEELSFLVRLIENGEMSRYLQSEASVGGEIEIAGPHGVFYLRDGLRPIVMVAGGTGIAPMSAMLRSMARTGRTNRPITLCFGVTGGGDLFYVEELNRLATAFERFDLRVAIVHPGPRWKGARGHVTDILVDGDAESGNVDAYLCGPPAMVESACKWLLDRNVDRGHIYAEEFAPSGVK